jgi:uncharacterized protein YutE (UPF0331/DUF86 family)
LTVNTIAASAERRWKAAARRDVVDRDVVLRKSEAIEHHTTRLRAKLPLLPEALDENESLLNDVCFDLLQAVQACIDLAVHACAHEALGAPESPASALALLAKHRIIGGPLAAKMTKAAGLRNLIVHRYGELDIRRLAQAISEGLGDLDEFAAALRGHAG